MQAELTLGGGGLDGTSKRLEIVASIEQLHSKGRQNQKNLLT